MPAKRSSLFGPVATDEALGAGLLGDFGAGANLGAGAGFGAAFTVFTAFATFAFAAVALFAGVRAWAPAVLPAGFFAGLAADLVDFAAFATGFFFTALARDIAQAP